MNGMLVTELAQIAEQEHMRSSLVAQAMRGERHHGRGGALRRLFRAFHTPLPTGPSGAAAQATPRPPAVILNTTIRREAR